MAKGYAGAADVGTYLGITLSAAQAAAATGLLGAVEQAVDAYCGTAWLTGAITSEIVPPVTPYAYLRSRPVTSLQAVRGRWLNDSGGTTLTATRDYQLLDARLGNLYVPTAPNYGWLEVDYTPATALPDAVRWATAMALAHFLSPHLNGVTSDVQQYAVFRELTVQLRDAGLPPDARLLLDTLSRAVVIA